MLLRKRKLAVLSLFVGVVAGGPGSLTRSPAIDDEPRAPAASPQPTVESAAPAPGRMFVTGRVLDPQGKPVPNAMVAIHARNWGLGRNVLARSKLIPMGEARADGSGRFRIDAPRTSSSRYDADLGAVALAPGYGAGWAELDVDGDQPAVDIALRPEQVIEGRLFDLQGQPVSGVTVSVQSIGRNLPPNPATGRPGFEGVSYSPDQVKDRGAWPRPATTDSEGRFTLRGVGRDLRVSVMPRHPRFAVQDMEIVTDGNSGPKSMTAALVPAQMLVGRVTYADTGKGVPHAPLEVASIQRAFYSLSEFETDAEGRFRVNPRPSERGFRITAFPPRGPALPRRREAGRVAQGSGRTIRRPRLTARRLDPRQGHRGGFRQARRRGERRLSLC
jgi:hypothetical protein